MATNDDSDRLVEQLVRAVADLEKRLDALAAATGEESIQLSARIRSLETQLARLGQEDRGSTGKEKAARAEVKRLMGVEGLTKSDARRRVQDSASRPEERR